MEKQNKQNKNTQEQEILELPDATVERLIVKQLLNPLYQENCIFVQQNFKEDWFKNKVLARLFLILTNYRKNYHSNLTKQFLLNLLDNDVLKNNKRELEEEINQLYKIDETVYDKKFLQDTLINFTKRKGDILCNLRFN